MGKLGKSKKCKHQPNAEEGSRFNFKSLLRSQDLFGHPVELNFDKNEYRKKSWIGGIFSILIMMYMIVLVITNLQKLRSNSSSDIKIFNGIVNLT